MHIFQSILNRFTAHFSTSPTDKKNNSFAIKDFYTGEQIIAMRSKKPLAMRKADENALLMAMKASMGDPSMPEIPAQKNRILLPATEPVVNGRTSSQDMEDGELLKKAVQASLKEETARKAREDVEADELNAAVAASLAMQQDSEPVKSREEINQQIKSDAQVAQELHDSLNEEKNPVLPQPAELKVQAKHPEVPAELPSKKPMAKYYRANDEYRSALSQANKKMHAHYVENNLRVVKNNGYNHNCMLISFIQHAKEDYTQQHEDLVTQYRHKLMGKNPDLKLDSALSIKTPGLDWLLNEINRDFKTDLMIDFQYLHPDGRLVISDKFGESSRMEIIFDQGLHFEAVTAMPLR